MTCTVTNLSRQLKFPVCVFEADINTFASKMQINNNRGPIRCTGLSNNDIQVLFLMF